MGRVNQSGGGGDTNVPPTPELAKTLEEDGTIEQNANVLNLYLDSADLLVGAPSPISVAQTTEPVSSIVFNGNYSRERYGRSAVSSKISLDTERQSLLLDNNQTEAEKALAFIACLEFSNGLQAVQNMTDAEVTNRDQPDLDKYNRYPESMFNNATELNQVKEEFVFDAINASNDAIEALTSYEE